MEKSPPGNFSHVSKIVKTYHCKMESVLAEEIAGLIARLQNRQDFNIEFGKIDKFNCQTRDEYEKKKEKRSNVFS